MKERGRYQIQCMKSRSSTGVGMKVDLEYNIETMRITDPGLEADNGFGHQSSKGIMEQIKSTSSVSPMIAAKPKAGFDIESKVVGNVDSTKLKQMLAGLKSKAE
jgi:hypothetical protein